jgi:hypothetical protein
MFEEGYLAYGDTAEDYREDPSNYEVSHRFRRGWGTFSLATIKAISASEVVICSLRGLAPAALIQHDENNLPLERQCNWIYC